MDRELDRIPNRGRQLSARDAEKVLGIREDRVRKWWQRRKFNGLQHYGVDKRGNPLFRERDLRDLAAGRRLESDMRRPYRRRAT